MNVNGGDHNAYLNGNEMVLEQVYPTGRE
jgi:hypothetical protein